MVELYLDEIALKGDAVEGTLVDVLKMDAGVAVACAGFRRPERAVVEPAQRGCGGEAETPCAAVAHGVLSTVGGGARGGKSARGSVGVGGVPVTSGYGVDRDRLKAVSGALLEQAVVEGEREAVVRRRAPVQRGGEGVSGGILTAVIPAEDTQIRVGGARDARGRGDAPPVGARAITRRILF